MHVSKQRNSQVQTVHSRDYLQAQFIPVCNTTQCWGQRHAPPPHGFLGRLNRRHYSKQNSDEVIMRNYVCLLVTCVLSKSLHHAEARGGSLGPHSIALHFITLRQGLFLMCLLCPLFPFPQSSGMTGLRCHAQLLLRF